MFGKKPFKKSGAPVRDVKEYDEEVIEIKRVTRVVKGGRRLRFRALVVIGNRKGKIGMGVGKSTEVTGAIQKAISQAKKHMINVILNESTIPHEVRVKYKSARLLLLPAGPGTGIIAGGSARKTLELAGVKNILSKIIGSSNKLNNTYAVFKALQLLEATPGMLKKKVSERVKENTEETVTEKEVKAKIKKPAAPAAKPKKTASKKPEPQKK